MNKIYFTLLSMFISVCVAAQTTEIRGKILDENGQPMSGVTVLVKETSRGTISDGEGEYRIAVPEGSVVTFSFLGYLPKELTEGRADFSRIRLEPDVTGMNEVVVVAYGTQTKPNLTGAVGTVEVKDLENRPIMQASMALQGQVAGVDVVQNSGQPGDDAGQIRIRGISSIANNNEPLVIIDGMEGDINFVNHKDIESISVLKDAASTAIYGVRAAAGVIIITTRSGSESPGKMTVSYNGSYGLQQPTALPKAVKVMEYLDLKEEMFLYNGEVKNYDSDRQKYTSGEKSSVNYYLRHFRISPMQQHHLNISMSGNNYRSSVSVGLDKQDGILIGTDNRKMSFRANIDMNDPRTTLFTKFSVSGYRTETTDLAMGSAQTIQDIHRAGPTSIFEAYNGLYGFYGRHMAQYNAGGRRLNHMNNVNAKLNLGFKPLKDLTIQGSFGVVYYGRMNDEFVAPIYTVGDLYGDVQNLMANYYQVRNTKTLSTTTNAQINYKKKIACHEIALMGGFEQYWWRSDWEQARRDNMSGFKPSLMLGDASTQANSSNFDERATRSFFGRMTYNYANRYLVEFNIRRDGSSRFLNNKWGTFPAVSGAWRISEEPFVKNSEMSRWADNLKFRASWGRLGNQDMSSNYTGYPVLTTTSIYDFNGSIVSGAAVTSLHNPDVEWEESRMVDVGFDATLFRKFTFTADWFDKMTTGMLLSLPIAPSLIGNVNGGPMQNYGTMRNWGLEFTLGYNHTFRNKLNLNTTFITSIVRNQVIKMGAPIINSSRPIIHMEGQALGSFYGYRMDGVYQMDDFTWQNNSDPSIPIVSRVYTLKSGLPMPSEGSPRPGDLKFADISGPDGVPDGEIDLDYDRTIIGNPFPDVSLSLNTNLTWKGIDFNMFWQAVIGRDMYNQGPMVIPFFNDNGNVWSDMVGKRWTVDNPTNSHPRLNYDSRTANTRSSYYIYDASFLRLKNIEVGYTLPKRWTMMMHISSLRFYAGIQNALTITNFPGWDPERPSTNIASEVYPQLVIYNFGVNVKF